MKIFIITLCALVGLQLFGTLVAGQQDCPDAAINACLVYITQPVVEPPMLEQEVIESCARLSNLSYCLPKNGCPADKPMTGKVRNAIQSGLSQICSANRERLVKAGACWDKTDTLSKLNACNTTFILSLISGTSFCDAAGTYLTCVQTPTLADCGAEAMLFYTKYINAAVQGFAVAKNCQILNNRCLPWNITTCLNNLNTPLGAIGLGKEALKSNIDKLCGKTDDISACLATQSCPSGNSFYLLVNNQIQSSYNAICQEKDKTSYYANYADCWQQDSVKSGVASCNNTFKASFTSSASYCASAGDFLKCAQDVVNAQCGSNSGVAIAGYFYSLLSINATAFNCTIDSKYAPSGSSSSIAPSGTLSISGSSSVQSMPSSVSSSASVSVSTSPSASAHASVSTTDAHHGGSAPHIQITVALILSAAAVAILAQLN